MFIWCIDWNECVESVQRIKHEDPEFHAKLRIQTTNYDRTHEQKEIVFERARSFVKYVEIKCLGIDELREKRIQQWVTQYRRNGNKAPSGKSEDPEMRRAGNWQNYMRRAYKDNKLSKEHIASLNATEGWEWEVCNTFEDQTANWVNQYKKGGNKPPRQNSEDPNEKRAAIWQKHMRQVYKGNKLSQERIATLNAIEGWEWEANNTYTFEEHMCNWITRYKKKGNKPPSRRSEDPNEKYTAVWQHRMRTYYKNTMENKKGTKLSQERIAALNTIEGWKWSIYR